MTVSIIIAVKTWAENLEECVARCAELDFKDFEIIVLPDENRDCPRRGLSLFSNTELSLGRQPPAVRIISTGPVKPADKRDIALKHAKGEVLAFLDDDAYPVKDWLRNALLNFEDKDVAAVGGPAITPLNDSYLQKASGNIYASFLVSGNFRYRYIPQKKRKVDDFPSCNFLVRKSVMDELGGFDTKFWPGEDTKLCLDITKKLKKKIIYDPRVLVYHHRRKVFSPHLKQIASYAFHRGYFVKKYPETSLKLAYFIPTLFLLFLIGGFILSFFCAFSKALYLEVLSLYLILAFVTSISIPIIITPLVFVGIVLTHLTYGFYFVKGLFAPKMPEE
ncbi:MAG: glycosyltransferase [Candidatus Omnitrophota bacterium]